MKLNLSSVAVINKLNTVIVVMHLLQKRKDSDQSLTITVITLLLYNRVMAQFSTK
jgi:hypothetical protein